MTSFFPWRDKLFGTPGISIAKAIPGHNFKPVIQAKFSALAVLVDLQQRVVTMKTVVIRPMAETHNSLRLKNEADIQTVNLMDIA